MTAKEIAEILDAHFPNPAIPLNHSSTYTFLIAVLLSAQSTDAKVNEISPSLFARASTPEKMITLTVEEIREIIKPIGLSPTKARAIHALSKILVQKYGGEVPDTFEALESLPGVGHKTASVILSQAFGKPAFPVDTHIFRCAHSWGLSQGRTVRQVEEDLKALFPEEQWTKLHLQIIHFARKFCPAKRHDPQKCPICKNF